MANVAKTAFKNVFIADKIVENTYQSYLQHLITINGEIIFANDDFMLDNKH